MAFPNDDRAIKARSASLAGGFSVNEVTRYNDETILECEKSNEQTSNPVQIEQEVQKSPSPWLLPSKFADLQWFTRLRMSDRNGPLRLRNLMN